MSIGLQSRLSIIYHIFLLLILNKDIFFHKNLLKAIGKLFDYNAISHILKSGWVGGGGKIVASTPTTADIQGGP